MRAALLLSLALLIGVAPGTIVTTRATPEKSPEKTAGKLPKKLTGKTPDASKKKKSCPKPKAPRKTQLIKLTPGQHPGSGHSIDQGDDDSSLLPDWPPALYARRLPVATVPPAPPAEPVLSSELRAGHLNLPPPAA